MSRVSPPKSISQSYILYIYVHVYNLKHLHHLNGIISAILHGLLRLEASWSAWFFGVDFHAGAQLKLRWWLPGGAEGREWMRSSSGDFGSKMGGVEGHHWIGCVGKWSKPVFYLAFSHEIEGGSGEEFPLNQSSEARCWQVWLWGWRSRNWFFFAVSQVMSDPQSSPWLFQYESSWSNGIWGGYRPMTSDTCNYIPLYPHSHKCWLLSP
jgi:hypothetical protein